VPREVNRHIVLIHQPVSMVSQCLLNAWLSSWLVEISADLSSSTLEVLHDDALYKLTNFTFYLAIQRSVA